MRIHWKQAELARLAAGLVYVSQITAPLRVDVLGGPSYGVRQPPTSLLSFPGVQGTSVEEDDSFRWLQPPYLAPGPGVSLWPGVLSRRCRELRDFFGQLNNAVAYKVGDGATKRVALLGRYAPLDQWLVLSAVVVE